jgi:hypothetical protein
VLFIFTVRDIIYEQQLLELIDFILQRDMLPRILLMYAILTIFAIVLIYSYATKKSEIVSLYGRIFEEPLGRKMRHFKCPNCNAIFTIKKSKFDNKKKSTITCPSCKTVGYSPTK